MSVETVLASVFRRFSMMSPAMTLCRANKHYVTISLAEQDHMSSDSRVSTGEVVLDVAHQVLEHVGG